MSGDGTDDLRCGYVALVGRPNVGKSTLLNRILGQKLSIVTAKPQTTRQRISGIKTDERGQVIYVDTPGIHTTAGKALNRYMNRVARASLHDVDLALFLIEADRWTRDDRHVAKFLDATNVPVILVVNKIDQVADKSRLLEFLRDGIDTDRYAQVFMISARSGDGVSELEDAVLSSLPFSRPYYDEDQLSDRSERFLSAELIREQLMLRLHQELPYALTVEIEDFDRGEDGRVSISAVVRVERKGQKKIVIGKGGQVLKQVGTGARLALEELLAAPVFLRLWVKVDPGWSDSEQSLRRLGYNEEPHGSR